MELDELKKSWNALDKHLQEAPIADEKQLAELIAMAKANTRRGLNNLHQWQYVSLITGGAGLIILLLIGLLLPLLLKNEETQNKLAVFLGFVAISIIGGLWWDWKTYRWNKNTLVDEMPIAVVSQRMNTFRQWTKYEVTAISAWVVLFNAFSYWIMGYCQSSFKEQAILITLFVLFDAVLLYFLYKKIIYKHLDDIKKNIDELKDICTE